MSDGDEAAADQEAALAALRDHLCDALGRRGFTRKDIVARSAAEGTPLGPTTVSQALNHAHPAPSWRTVTAIARALGADSHALEELRGLWLRTRPRPGAAPPRPPADVVAPPDGARAAGPGLLEVQQAPHLLSDADGGAAVTAAPFLTPYLRRPHDEELEHALRPALEGTASALVVLTGDSSTGKTRALFEALQRLAPARSLWRPTRAAALADLLLADRIAPGEGLWLNEAQRFFYGERSEEAAAALRELLLTRPGIAAVGTLWTLPYWEDLVRPAVEQDPRSHVRALLEAPVTRRIPVPSGLTGGERSRWERLAASSGDLRMARAVQAAGTGDGRVVQHLSGGPQLLAAYRTGPGSHFTHAEHALVTAAIAARLLGHHPPLPEELLTRAADAALAPHLRPAEPDWARTSLTAVVTGVRADGPRTDIRNTLTALVAVRDTSGGATAYEPADYLHQSLLAAQETPDPTPALWDALTACTTDPYALNALSIEAQERDFLKQAVLLLRRAAVAGYPAAWKHLRLITPHADRDSRDMALWTADHFGLGSADAALWLLWELRAEGPEATARLAARIVARTDLTDADEAGRLFDVLHELGHARLLLARSPEEHVGISAGSGALRLLDRLLDAGHRAPAERLLDRLLSRGAPLGNPWASGRLLKALRVCGHRPAALEVLAWEIAHHTELSDLRSALELVEELQEAGRDGAARRLADRIADAADPHRTEGVASLLYELGCLGMTSACRRLAERVVPGVALEEPGAVGWLLDELRSAGLEDEVEAVLARDPVSEVEVIGPVTGVVLLLWSLQAMDREEPARRLVLRGLPDVEPDNAEYAGYFLDLLARFGDPHAVTRFAWRAVEEVPVTPAARLGFLARSLRQHGRPEPVDRLARRAIAAADPRVGTAFVDLLRMLREQGLDGHARALVERAAEHPGLSYAVTHEKLPERLRTAGEPEAADRLEAAAPSAAAAPARVPHPPPPSRTAPTGSRRPYGLETDGAPARPWGWSDLERPGATLPAHRRHDPAPVTDPGPWPAWGRYCDN
ncbi:hypothetical protein OG749_29220 [Streptomyces nojiriensis]|uniref:hypothetical protein n=1 Tax=Streptomyces nojiriensis TaxID=66374 RepID=UPI002E19AB61